MFFFFCRPQACRTNVAAVPTQNQYTQPPSGVGGWTGKCTCPDGLTYSVGDLGDSCVTIACFNGTVTRKCDGWYGVFVPLYAQGCALS